MSPDRSLRRPAPPRTATIDPPSRIRAFGLLPWAVMQTPSAAVARRAAALALALLTLTAAACHSAPDCKKVALRVMAYNVKHGRGMDDAIDLARIAAVIRTAAPDVVTLQEIDKLCGRSGEVDQAARLAELCGGMHHAFGAFMDYDGGEYGMAILSRYPIRRATNVRLPPGAEPRTALEVRIMAPGEREVIVTGVHLYRTEAERLAQAEMLADLYVDANVPVVLAGDFNSLPGTAVMQRLAADFRIAEKTGAAATFPADAPDREIDFVLAAPRDRVVIDAHHVVAEPVASDHRPIVADLTLLAPAAAR